MLVCFVLSVLTFVGICFFNVLEDFLFGVAIVSVVSHSATISVVTVAVVKKSHIHRLPNICCSLRQFIE